MINKLIILAGFFASVLHLQSREDYSRDVIAAVLMGEGRSGGVACMRAVAEVIRNRGGDPVKVVTAYRQFSCLNVRSIGSFIRKMKREPEWPKARLIANDLLVHPEHLGNSVNGANHFEQVGKTPFWAVGLTPVATVGKLNFFICR